MKSSPRLTTLCVTAMLLAALTLTAFAGGQEDDSANSYESSGAIMYLPTLDEEFAILHCSGALIHPRVFMTAGHCGAGEEGHEEYPEIRVSIGYDAFDKDNWHDVDAVILHPDYEPGVEAHGHDLNDVILLVLKEAVEGVTPAKLAPKGFLDGLVKKGLLEGSEVTIAGYGDDVELEQGSDPVITPRDGYRDIACPTMVGVTDDHLTTLQNVGDEFIGFCYGDSGSGVFWTKKNGKRLLIAMPSAPDSPDCTGLGYSIRIDTESVLDFIKGVIEDVEGGLYD